MEIEANVPIPSARRRVGRQHVFPLRDLEIGDSFLIPWGDHDRERYAAICRSVISRYGSRYRTKYATRTGEDGLRVWRID